MRVLDRSPGAWIALGIVLLALAQVRFGLGMLAWIAWAPWLRYLRLRPGWRGGLVVGLGLVAAWTLATAKICTEPVPVALAPLYGVPLAVFSGLPLLGYAALRRRLDGAWVPALFPAAMVLGEWAQHAGTPFGSWGAAAYTQLDALPLLQVAAVVGMAGPSFLVHLGSVVVDELLAGGGRRFAAVAGAAIATAYLGGEARLVAAERSTDTLRVAAVGTDAVFGGLPLPDAAERAAIDAALEGRVRQAAAAGARLVVGTEAGTLVLPEDEEALLARFAGIARELRVTLVLAYVVPVEVEPLRYLNRARVLGPDGEIGAAWDKHRPVPGEPAVAGVGLPEPAAVEGLRLGTAICYDADFPRLALGLARQEIDVLAVPSSDWRGIDPLHTHMARLRAIEGGYGLVRSTRFGTSAVVDRLGRVWGAESAFDAGDRVLVAELPGEGAPTPYRRLGDGFVAACAVAVAAAALRSAAWPPSSASRAARS